MKIKNLMLIILIIALLIVFCIAFYKILTYILDNCENTEAVENLIESAIEEDEETEEKNIDWDYLKSINEDIVAWIEIEDTNINYPILKDDDSLYYLRHTYNKKYNSNGSIFTIDIEPFKEAETTLYGHNMKNGSMFATLSKYFYDEEFLMNHINIKIYTPEQNYNSTIFSVYSINVNTECENIKQLNFSDKIEYYKAQSKYNISTTQDITKIVKMSTCSYFNATTTPTAERFYIIANVFPV